MPSWPAFCLASFDFWPGGGEGWQHFELFFLWPWSEQTHTYIEKTYKQCTHLCTRIHVHTYTHIHPCTCVTTPPRRDRGAPLSPAEAEGRKLGVVYLFSPSRQCPLPEAGVGWSAALNWPRGRSPSGPYFTDTPDRARCQERCLISSPACWPRSPHKEGYCIVLPPLASALQRSDVGWEGGAQRGFAG